MSAPATTAPSSGGLTAIRVGIAVIGVTGFALSYAALRQMAVATNTPGPLTYAFPILIDGFIAIGTGALLLMRTAPWRARLYVWSLVGVATLTSVWANALHAIRLNQQTRHEGIHLDDVTVGALSAIAPLALAGAVHFYLLTRHHQAQHEPSAHPLQGPLAELPTPVTGGTDVAESPPATADIPTPAPPTTSAAKPRGRRPSASVDQLVAIGRTVPRGPDGLIQRTKFEATVRGAGHPVAKDRVVKAMKIIHAETGTTADTPA
ncbi:DUF2637 domain-containing protein [Streptomyces antarcticus]|uniref:DUF2637 domain-containing protein n=1 Tax=Streptomyces antarcticus TaxID=2996458 RepID=UPI00226D6C56|nr:MULTISPECIES: DUF2637 domain-containing protein [unclassified Streptomyces]MCY0943617.1 DUF2637 domain-containing protein [Streptomyces sp. H34-AA3]MCZ4086035.1 DUF2637 domain-containing protein [Streptomyces sp. H34-S5]